MLQDMFGLQQKLHFPGYFQLLFALSSIVYFYGGWPFLQGLWDEVTAKNPGMMTLIGVAITAAWTHSGTVAFGFPGKMFFWELVTLIDMMLLGHWMEMKSVMGAGKTLEKPDSTGFSGKMPRH